MKEGVLNPSKKTRVLGFIAIITFMILAITNFTFAATETGGVFEKIKTALSGIYSGIFGISTALAILCVVIGLICAQLTTNQQKTARWIDFVKKAVIIWIILNSLLFLFKFISGLTAGGKIEDINNSGV